MLRGRYTPRSKKLIFKDVNDVYEMLKSGNTWGDNGNWGFFINGNNLELRVRISGTWTTTRAFERPV